MAGIEEFLEQVKVLPAGQWDPLIRIEPPEKVPLQVGAAGQGGRRAAQLGMLLRGTDSQGPT